MSGEKRLFKLRIPIKVPAILAYIAITALCFGGTATPNPVEAFSKPAAKPSPQSVRHDDGPSTTYLPALGAYWRSGGDNIMGAEVNSIDEAGHLSRLENANVRWLRNNAWAIVWHEVEPNEGQRDWTSQKMRDTERQMAIAAQRGMKLIQIVRGTPGWARKTAGNGATCGPIRQDKFYAFADFMRELVQRYSAPPFNVRYWEIGNEPDAPSVAGDNVFGCWTENENLYQSGRYFGDMLNAVYPAIKSASPDSQVVIGGMLLNCDPRRLNTNCAAASFFDGIMDSDAGGSFDIANFHAYDYWKGGLRYANENWGTSSQTNGPSLIAKTEYVREVMARHGFPNKAIVNTEYALLCYGCANAPNDFENAKAIYVAQANAAALAKGLLSNVWYSVPGWTGYQTHLLYHDGNVTSAYNALRTSTNQLSESTFVREDFSNPGVRAYVFDRKGQAIWVVWAQSVDRANVNLPELPLAVYDMYGRDRPNGQQITVDNFPVYVEFSR